MILGPIGEEFDHDDDRARTDPIGKRAQLAMKASS